MKPPTFGAILAGLVPFVAVCFSVSYWDRVQPMILGLPFNLFWLIAWTVLTPACLGVAYRLDVRPGDDAARRRKGNRIP